ncbi:MAG: hypothetical protein HKO66_13555 [Saprospiraceae bacterium]|nr:hypothetical protein [Bacteroidia bacterium]NNE15074.1 hypothetical protein [Saprospiraceae bacterium]NNL93261.1 hypothetical protein [Saprospiraceae bacterium]
MQEIKAINNFKVNRFDDKIEVIQNTHQQKFSDANEVMYKPKTITLTVFLDQTNKKNESKLQLANTIETIISKYYSNWILLDFIIKSSVRYKLEII